MNRTHAAIGALVLAGCLAVLAGAADAQEERCPATDESFLHAYYYPPDDRNQGRLYPAAADLLNAARRMPDKIRLGGAASAQKPAEARQTPRKEPGVEQPSNETGGTHTETGPQSPGRWVSVLNFPVVSEEKLAYAYYAARSYKEAANIYRRLRGQAPDDLHLLLMLALCERNVGNNEKAEELLSDVDQNNAEAQGWAGWMIRMMEISGNGEEDAE